MACALRSVGVRVERRPQEGADAGSTPAQIRALLAPAGLELCETRSPQGQRATRSCRRFTRATLSDAVVRRRALGLLDGVLGSHFTQEFTCLARRPSRCDNGPYQGETYAIEFAGVGAHRRVARIEHADQMLGE